MGLRICLVTPFSWSQPHEVNEHVDAVARELRVLGHEVTVLAPSNRADDLREGRKAMQRELLPDVVALGPVLPISRRCGRRRGCPLPPSSRPSGSPTRSARLSATGCSPASTP